MNKSRIAVGAAGRDVLLECLTDLIGLMTERYGDVVYAWDVVNEAVRGSPSDKVLRNQAERYREIFEVLRANSDVVTGVTFWGIADDATWLDDFPVPGRKNWPLLFTEDHLQKPAYHAVVGFQPALPTHLSTD